MLHTPALVNYFRCSRRLHLLLAAVIFLLSNSSFAATIRGRVTKEDGTPLPYATIVVAGTTKGVTANGTGYYELSLDAGLHKVICQYVGYTTASTNVSVTATEVREYNFSLKNDALEMSEVVIRASTEDPAYPIIRNAIKQRRFHLAQVKSFQAGMYFKGVARSRSLPGKFMGQKINPSEMGADTNGKGVLYLVEEDADYYSYGSQEKTVIHSVRESGNKNGFGFPSFPSVITFYENNVRIFTSGGRGFISPISDNAIFYYKYKLLGEVKENDQIVYKISVTPRRAYEPCFSGTLYITDGDWAVQSLDLRLLKQSGMELLDTMQISQMYVPDQKGIRVIKSQVIYFTVNALAFDITANGVAVYNRQIVNEPIPDTFFAGKVTSSYDKLANKKDTSWLQARPIPLQADEQKDYIVKDSMAAATSSPAYLDSIRRHDNHIKPIGLLLRGYTYTSHLERNTLTINPIILSLTGTNMVNYNIVEGLTVAPRLSLVHRIDSAGDKVLHIDIATRYGFSNEHFNAVARLYHFTRRADWPSRSLLYGIEGGRYVYQYNAQNPVVPLYNGVAALLWRQNDLKVYERWDAAVYLRRNFGNGLSWFIKTSLQQRLPLNNTTTYSLVKGSMEGFSTNTPPQLLAAATAWEKHTAAILNTSIAYRPGATYTQYPDFKLTNSGRWPLFTLSYQKGIKGILQSKSDFDKWRLAMQDNMSLKLLGSLNYMVATGGFLNSTYVSIPDLFHLYGNRGIGFANPYLQSFQFAQYYDFSNAAELYGEAHIEYHLRGLLTNKIPAFRQLRFYAVTGANTFYTYNGTYYAEAFAGLENIGWKLFRVFRIDFVQSWDSRGGRNSGIRIGISSPNISISRSNPTGSEW